MPDVMILGPKHHDAERLAEILSELPGVVRCGHSLGDLERVLQRGNPTALFCFRQFEDGTILDVLQFLKLMNRHVPVVVVAKFSRSKEAAEAMASGAVDFLPTPLDPSEVAACTARLFTTPGDANDPASQPVRFEARDGVLIFHFPEEMDFKAASELGRLIDKGIPHPEHGIILDLEKTRYFSSSGISLLFIIYAAFECLQGRLLVASARPYLRNTLNLAGADSFFRFTETQEDALAALSART